MTAWTYGLLVAVTSCLGCAARSPGATTTAAELPVLREAFVTTLRHTPSSPDAAVPPPQGRRGAYIGSGDGQVQGDRIRGNVRWSAYSGECFLPLVRAGQSVPEGMHVCTLEPAGIIETADGAKIQFEASGYAMRNYDPKRPGHYRVTMALRLSTSDARYDWLNTTLGVWVGEFDEDDGTAHYRAYIPAAARD